jgi:RNA polymerase sigma-70 factor (ECF subfamily)
VGTLAQTADLAMSPDDALLRRARSGDRAAFDLIVASRIDRCYRIAWSILLNEADAADATQDALVAVWRQLPRLRSLVAFDGWLNRIVANQALMARRHRVRLREVPVQVMADDEEPLPIGRQRERDRSTPQDELVDNDAIARAFDRLRPKERLILALHHVEERSVAEIASSLGIPVGTVKWRLHAARSALERALEAEA